MLTFPLQTPFSCQGHSKEHMTSHDLVFTFFQQWQTHCMKYNEKIFKLDVELTHHGAMCEFWNIISARIEKSH